MHLIIKQVLEYFTKNWQKWNRTVVFDGIFSLSVCWQKDIRDELKGARTSIYLFCSNVAVVWFCKEISLRKLVKVATNDVKYIIEIFDFNRLICFILRNINISNIFTIYQYTFKIADISKMLELRLCNDWKDTLSNQSVKLT